MKTSIKGIQAAQAAALKAAAAVKPKNGLGRAVRYATLAAHRFATAETVVATGTWRASHRPEVRGARGRIYVDPNSVNPRGGGRPSRYGPALEMTRGGRYAVYGRTAREAGPRILAQAGAQLKRELP
ncbi:MAG: hypothetical protein GFH27_549283n415 [Chloroflexi bacterium AL-W]|nr:hypothetical protein [Chloroflexi bacterium AL-N1]NOK64464.1 hypothetical protein [Chloroflexi bacterium AL-N10]NOK75706.1 hypothetical protein [Chloroflexi bacterium AL-N5]NOK80536.1 hypothetical protein [Chloroflexi bacterium AL-W]NOK87050.1 hypothetical protein [Chloroflexi bacterium AL-N15]